MNDAEYASKCDSIEEWNARRPERMKRFQERVVKQSEERQAVKAKKKKNQMDTTDTKSPIGNSRN